MNKFTAIALLSSLLLFGCQNNNLNLKPLEIHNIEVISDTLNLLAARINMEAYGDGDIFLEVEPSESNSSYHSPIIHRRNPGDQIRFDILGLSENTSYTYRIKDRLRDNILDEGDFVTAPISDWMRSYLPETSHELDIDGLILMNRAFFYPSSFYVVDPSGRLILARASDSRISVVRTTPRGTILTMLNDAPGTTGSNAILETTLAGDTLVYLQYGEKGFNRLIHHDVVMTDDHQFLAITESEKNGVVVDGLMLLDRSGNLVWQWDTSEVNPTDSEPYIQPWGNSIYFDDAGNFIVSFRRISQVWKINKDTRQVMWRLGKDGTIPVEGDDVFLLQHTASLISPNQLMMFDNGQDRSRDIFLYDKYRPYSRIAFYDLNDQRTEVTGTTYFDLDEKYFTWATGSVVDLGDSYLVGASIPGYVLHLDQSGNILGELKFGDRYYRAEIMQNFLKPG